MLAVEGKTCWGELVEQMIRSTLLGGTSATSRALRAASTAKEAVVSLGLAATWRFSMPVRLRIHSSLVSTICSSSLLVITLSGT